MSSYQELKQLALKKTEQNQAALAREREAKEKDAAAKRAAIEARERQQREMERKLVAQKMALRREQEAKEKARREADARLESELVSEAPTMSKEAKDAIKRKLLGSSSRTAGEPATRTAPSRARSRSTATGGSDRKRKPKADEDDFVGNRADRLLGKSNASGPSSASSSAASPAKRRPLPLTREEKQQMKRAREFGSLPRAGALLKPTSSSNSSSRASPAATPTSSAAVRTSRGASNGRSKPSFSNGLVALGTTKRDQRSIDEIERDLRRLKEGKADSSKTQSELEKEAALLRRQKAMEERRRTELEARDRAKNKKDDPAEDDDLFGSDEDSSSERKKNSSKSATQAFASKPSTSTPAFSRKDAVQSAASPAPVRQKDNQRDFSPAPRLGGINGINPADFLPGAPLRPEVQARLAQVARAKSASASDERVTPSKRRSGSPADAALRGAKKAKTSNEDTAPVSASPAPGAPPKRETERDRFIREQEEKKAVKARGQGAKQPLPRRRSSSDHDGEEEDDSEADSFLDDEDEYEAAGGADASYRDEIWKMFGKDRKQYASRVVDSDDDMEADASAVFREEMRSAREAREEDLREEELERKREREKALRKKAAVNASLR